MTDQFHERVAKLEAILEHHDNRIIRVERNIEELNDRIHDLDMKISNLDLLVKNVKRDIEKSNQRAMWFIGTAVTVAGIVANVLVALFLH